MRSYPRLRLLRVALIASCCAGGVFHSSAALGEGEKEAARPGDEERDTRVVSGESVAHWSRLPILGEEARQRGFELPQPFGVSVNFYWEEQPFDVESIKVGPLDGELLKISDFVATGDAETEQSVVTGRFDAWLLPFMNLYGIIGYADGEAEIQVDIPAVPALGFPGSSIDVNLDYDGLVYGGGMTLAGGFKPLERFDTILFVVADANYAVTDLDFKDDDVDTDTLAKAIVFGGRVGLRDTIFPKTPIGKITGAVWVGAMLQEVSEELAGQVPEQNFEFVIKQDSAQPWNFITGGRIEIGKHLEAMVEVGIGHRDSVLLGGTLRF